MKQGFSVIFIFLFFFGCSSGNKSGEHTVTVFCASSLTDVISEITASFEKENHIQVKLNLASSGTLARQIEHGAAPAIFISANKKWVDYLNQLNLTIPESEKKVAGNSLVLIAPKESPLQPFAYSPGFDLPDLFNGRLSIGDPNHVPAGQYTVQMLGKLGCLNKLQSRFLPAQDVRSALMVVELGEVGAGIVYKTDALKSDKVKILTEFPDSLHNPIYYYMSVIKGKENADSKKLYNYITSEGTVDTWKKYGFVL